MIKIRAMGRGLVKFTIMGRDLLKVMERKKYFSPREKTRAGGGGQQRI